MEPLTGRRTRRTVLKGMVGAAAGFVLAPVDALATAGPLAADGQLEAAAPTWGQPTSTKVGLAIIPQGRRSVSITFWPPENTIHFTSRTFALLTPRSDLGSLRLWYSLDRVTQTLTLKTSSAVPGDLAVGWMLIESY